MDNAVQKQQNNQSNENSQTAVPYIPPPPPDINAQKKFRPPLVNGMLFAVVILLGGFMMYNFLGHQLTQLAGVSDIREVVPTPTVTPTMTPKPTKAY
jgi:hypothetical protein